MIRSIQLALFFLGTLVAFGCNPAALSYFLFKGDGKAPADFPIKPADGKKEITVAILMTAPNAPTEFAGADRDLARMLGQTLVEQTREKKNPIRVVDQSTIDRFRLTTPGWRTLAPGEIGRQLRADYVIDATVSNLGLYEANSGNLMYQGQGSVAAVVFETATGRQHSDYFVNAKLDTKPADMLPVGQYRQLLLKRIAEELSWKHLPHISDRRVAPAQ